jgi:mannose-6-phosphate isomerase-like protein (cupin superfamily)
MDDEARQAMASMSMPRRPINFVSAKSGEILKLGHITCRVMEDGSRTDNRLGSAEFTLPGNTAGPPAHWHEMHDETFLVTQGVVRVRLQDSPKSVNDILNYE